MTHYEDLAPKFRESLLTKMRQEQLITLIFESMHSDLEFKYTS